MKTIVVIPVIVNDCRNCPNGKVSKYFTEDVWEESVQVHCQKLNGEQVGIYVWNDKLHISSKCPYLETNQERVRNPITGKLI